MSSRLWFGNDAPLPDALGIAWVAIAGWAMGTTALSYLLVGSPLQPFQPSSTLALLFCGLAPALLSGAAAWFGTRGRGVAMTAALTMVGSLMAALLCPPLTWLALVVSGGETDVGHVGMGNSVVDTVMAVTIVGAIFAAPLGFVFGTVYAIALSLFTALQRRLPSRSDFNLALLACGIGLVFVGIACFAASAYSSRAVVGTMLAPELATGLGLLGVLIGAGRYVARRAFIWRATRGAIADWAVVPTSDIADAESLPRLFAFEPAETVLVRREANHAGHFHSGEASTPIARC